MHLRRPLVSGLLALEVALAAPLAACGASSTSNSPSPSPVPSEASAPPADASLATLRFAAVGDTGKGNQGQKRVADAIAAKCERDGCDFVQLLGDNIYESGIASPDDPLMQSRFEEPYANVNAPFWVVLGNHDYGAGGLGNDFERGKNEVDYTAKSTKWKLPSNYWHRVAANAEFFGLDTNLILFRRAEDQNRDFAEWIPGSTATWKIALGHHPYLSNGPHGNAGSYDGRASSGKPIKDFFDANVCGKVDLYLSGHDHSSQWLQEPCGGTTELIVAGAGAEGTSLGTANKSHFQTKALSFFYVVIQGKTLTAELVDQTGAVLFTRTLQKP